MDYKNLEIRGKDLILRDIKHFIPSQVLDCGQCFRWEAVQDDDRIRYIGIAHGRQLSISLEDSDLIFENTSQAEFKNIWCDYFDLGRNYGLLREDYVADQRLKEALAFSPGLRLMRQDPWETVITFILSQNCNIPRIKTMVSRLCEAFGKPIPGGFAFPTPKHLSNLNENDLNAIKCGYRAKYIIDAAKRVADGRLPINEMFEMPTEDIRQALMEVSGIGPKVADCILLYGFGRVERYPMDVWMKRVMASWFPDGFPKNLLNTAGIAQQFLFHFARMRKI